MTRNYTNINIVLSPEHKKILKGWAKNDDRSVSSLLRQMIEKEIERREAEKQTVTTGHFEDL